MTSGTPPQWKEAFQTALTNFKTRKEALLEDAAELYGILNRNYRLPSDFSEPLNRARADLKTVLELSDNNVGEAETAKRRIEKEFTSTMAAPAKHWATGWRTLHDTVERLAPLSLPLDAARIAMEWKAADDRHVKIAEFADAPSLLARAQLKDMLETVHRNYAFSSQFTPELQKALEAFRDALEIETHAAGHGNEPLWRQSKGCGRGGVANEAKPMEVDYPTSCANYGTIWSRSFVNWRKP